MLKNLEMHFLNSYGFKSKNEIYDHRKEKFLRIGRKEGFSKSSSLNSRGLSYKGSSMQKIRSHFDKNKLIYAGIGLLAVTSLIVLVF